MIRNLPTSRVRSVAIGLAELSGTARPAETPLTSPVRQLPCAWWKVRVTRYEPGAKGQEQSRVVLNTGAAAPFQLDDGTGMIRVEPAGAEVTGVQTCNIRINAGDEPAFEIRRYAQTNGYWSVWPTIAFRIEEWAILTEAPVYVLGQVERTGGLADRRRMRVAEILKGWLASPEQKRVFDTNQDGVLQPEEWDAARAQAQSAALTESPAADAAPHLAVRRPASGWFLVCSGSERDALAARGHPALWLAGGTVLVVAGLWQVLAGVG